MQRYSWLSIVVMLSVGCAGSQAARPLDAKATTAEQTSDASSSMLAKKQEEQQQRIAELEARLALLESDARSRRDRPAAPLVPTETVRIRERRERERDESPANNDSEPAAVTEEAPVARDKHERIPSLRLYGSQSFEAGQGTPSPVDAGGLPSLAVAPLPEERARTLVEAAPSPTDATSEYRAGLRFLREQRYDEALRAFDDFAARHPDDARVSSALYWRAEAHYAKRDYQRAREAFEALLSRFAKSEKAADSMLKVGLCLKRLGDDAQAKVYFRRVQEQFPKSQAAQAASREGST